MDKEKENSDLFLQKELEYLGDRIDKNMDNTKLILSGFLFFIIAIFLLNVAVIIPMANNIGNQNDETLMILDAISMNIKNSKKNIKKKKKMDENGVDSSFYKARIMTAKLSLFDFVPANSDGKTMKFSGIGKSLSFEISKKGIDKKTDSTTIYISSTKGTVFEFGGYRFRVKKTDRVKLMVILEYYSVQGHSKNEKKLE